MKKHSLTLDGYVIKKTDITAIALANLKKKLSVTPIVNQDYKQKVDSFQVYKETESAIIIPKFYGLALFGSPQNLISTQNLKIAIEFQGRLRDTQVQVAATCLEKIKNGGGGLLQFHTGYGKTTLGLYLAAQLGLKTIVLVHKSFLQDQWYERAKQFTNANLGIIHQKKVDIEGKDIVIGMVQSISMIDYDPEIFKQFGLVICDECFPAYMRVVTDRGVFSIKYLYELWKEGHALPLVESFNQTTGRLEFKQLTHAWEKHATKLVRVTLDKAIIDCTPNHLFLTMSGYKKASKLTAADEIIGNDLAPMNVLFVSALEINDTNKLVYDIEVANNHNFIVLNTTGVYGPIVHNCHHMGSRVFSKALLKISPKYTIGLSATPNRSDGMTKIVNWFLGPILVKVERKGDNAVYIKSFEYTSNNPLFVEKKRWINGKIKPDPIEMITNMYKIDERNNFVANVVTALRRIDERKILVLSGRIEHLKILKKLVDNLITADIQAGNCYQDEIKTAFYMGKMKEYELKDAEEADIIFGTYSMAEEGLDIPGLNTLVLATPKRNIIQSIGRIMRKPIEEGDINPLIIDIIDDLSCFTAWADQRNQYYRSKKYTRHTYRVYNENVVSFKDYMVRQKLVNETDATTDLRKAYIIDKYGEDDYQLAEDMEFCEFPDENFYYKPELASIFTINHEYTDITNEKKVEINLDPQIPIEL